MVGEYYLFRGEASCLVLPCSNALAGEHYTGTGTPTSVLGCLVRVEVWFGCKLRFTFRLLPVRCFDDSD